MSSLIFKINKTDKIIAQAQAIQAIGARKHPDVRMNPILLKPIGNYESEVYLCGNFFSKMKAQEYYNNFVLNQGFELVLNAFKSLRKENDIIVLEGAGSPAEINILKYDIANMLLAKKVKVPSSFGFRYRKRRMFCKHHGNNYIIKTKIQKFNKRYFN